MAVGFLSLPIELICHILILLNPRDISRCAMTCNTFRIAVRNSVDIQYKLEIHAEGLISTETAATMNSICISRKMCSLKKLASLWRSDFHAHTTFETVVTLTLPHFLAGPWEHTSPIQSVKCGLWWMHLLADKFYIHDCSTNPKLSQTLRWSTNDMYPQHWAPGFVAFDPLQDLMVVFSAPGRVTVTNVEQEHCIFSVEFRLASSQRLHPDAVHASLECKRIFDAPGNYCAVLVKNPVICGDRVFVFYNILMLGTLIQVIDWRKGYSNSHFLCERAEYYHLVDEQKIVVISSEPEGLIRLYTLQGLDGPPRRRLTYHLPKSLPLHDIYVHGHSSFHGKAAYSELMPSYIPSLESQIMVLEFFPTTILVIDMAIFSDMALHSDMPVEIPWSEWGPRHTYCFPHHPSYRISVFGSKMAYALPQDRVPDPGQRLVGLSTEGYFYVHIWDFNKRVIARSESVNDPDSPDLFICKPGRMTDSFGDDIFSNHAYTATVCRTPFPTRGSRLFLELDRLTLTWTRHGEISIQVISPVQTEVGPES